jgi:hypothetical protein
LFFLAHCYLCNLYVYTYGFMFRSLIGCIGLVGIFSGEPGHIHIGVLCVSAVECRAGTSIFGCFAGLGGGPVRVFCLLGLVLACVCVI